MTRESESFSVLLVKSSLDDFHFVKQSLQKSYGSSSFIDIASNLEDAFEKLKQGSYHMALVESEIEDEYPDFLEKINQNRGQVPFVLLLPVKDDRLVREAIRCGIADVIVKSENQFQQLSQRLRESYQIFRKKSGLSKNDSVFEARSTDARETAEPLVRDELTGLYTHSYLYERIVREFSRAERYSYPISSVLIDIDSFRTINEQHGYFSGELLLKEMAQLLFENCRMTDFIARYGGEEFCIILPHSGYDAAQELASRIKMVIEGHIFLADTQATKVTVSIGIASHPEDSMNQRGDLIYFANEALLHSKSLGRSRITLFKEVIPEVNEDLPDLKISEEKIAEFQRRMGDINTTFRRSYIDTSRMLISALEGKDKHTVGHSATTAKYSYWTAQVMGFGHEEAEIVRHGALLHDIGKICIPDNILLKPGRLTLEEFETMKQHSYLGYKIIKPIKFLQQESLVVLHHHEWFNGEGYPCRLKGNEIPLGARIVQVVDSYDTMRMAGGRYKKTSTVEDTINELIACSNTQFDPAVVKAFIEVLKSRGELQTDNYNQERLEEAIKVSASLLRK
jgi:diguanylate cyclase (GGDEF)-like protein/putative nucleotidyltransferase with HDIG domain